MASSWFGWTGKIVKRQSGEMTKTLFHLFACGALIMLLVVTAPAQVATGTINISVQDSSGAAVPGAAVHVLNLNTGVDRAGTTNDSGQFAAPFVTVGPYTVTAEHDGFT